MKCPVCNVDLLMGERLSVSIDYCPQCRGIWLEKGKLDQLIGGGVNSQHQQRSGGSGGVLGSMMEKMSDSDHHHSKHGDHHESYHGDHEDHDSYQKKQKKSFLDGLF